MDHFSVTCESFKLKINLKKIKVMFTSLLSVPYKEPTIIVKDTRLEIFVTFPFLRISGSRNGALDTESFLISIKQMLHLGDRKEESDQIGSLALRHKYVYICYKAEILSKG